jgi:hypothetical protein
MIESDNCTKLPPGIDCQDIIAFGTTGLIARYPGTLRVAKIPHGGDPDARALMVSTPRPKIVRTFHEKKTIPSGKFGLGMRRYWSSFRSTFWLLCIYILSLSAQRDHIEYYKVLEND